MAVDDGEPRWHVYGVSRKCGEINESMEVVERLGEMDGLKETLSAVQRDRSPLSNVSFASWQLLVALSRCQWWALELR